MKKLAAVAMALVLLFSFALAETETEATTMNFRELVGEETLSQGTYTQLGNLSMHIWIPNGKFSEVEIPQDDEEYADTVMILSYDANPDFELVIEAGETDVSIDDALADLQSEENAEVFSNIKPGIINGINGISYDVKFDDGTVYTAAEFYVDNYFVSFSCPTTDDAELMQYASMITCSLEII